ncbi:MAG: hypothetical protein J0L92_41260, partial [Deltaproteobacteria bacterium]|nr:hypothetical protein [Deltaproteobacteria bacterium]
NSARILARLSSLSRSTPGIVWSALRRPSVYVHLRLAADGGGAAHLATGLAALAAELAATGGLDAPLVLRAPPPQLIVRSRRQRFVLDPSPLQIGTDGTLRQHDQVVTAEPASVPVSGAIDLALVDDNPLSSLEAHPDKSGSQLDLGEATPEQWVASLRDALDRIATHLPLLRSELDLVLSCLVPVGTDPERHLSASYREALGLVYLSLHPDPLTMTEAVVHEAQHNKLNAALTIDPLLENPPDERHPSPVRPDPRPLLGVLLAVHAFVPVAALYRAMRLAGDPIVDGPRVHPRLTRILEGNEEGLTLLERHARPTALGSTLLEELRAIHDETVEPPRVRHDVP